MSFDPDLRRRRAAVVLRAPLAVPAVALLLLFSVAAAGTLPIAWVGVILTRRVPEPVHRFLRVYVRYALRVSAWTTLTVRRYPRLRGASPPVVEVERARQSRLTALLRAPLALPSLVLASVFAAVVVAAAIGAWFVALLRGRTTEGLRELAAFCLRYEVEAAAFFFLLTPRAPRLDPPTEEPR